MKTVVKLVLLAAMISLAATMSSCKKDDDTGSSEEHYTSMNDIVIGMTFDTFLTPDDVAIENDDTTSILVSKPYLESLGQEIIEQITYIAVWLAPTDYPFYRQVMKSEDADEGHLRLTVTRADVSCCLPEGRYNLSTEIYNNGAEDPRIPRMGGAVRQINSDFYYDPYEDEYHPVAVFPDKRSCAGVGDGDIYEVNYFNLPSPMVEDIVQQNWSINPSLNIKFDTKNKFFGGDEGDDDSNFKVGLEYAKLEASAGVRLTLDVGVRMEEKDLWIVTIYYPCPYLEEFAAAFNAEFKAEYQLIAEFYAYKSDDKDYPIFKCSAINSVFMIGPIPVLIDCEPEFIFRYEYDVMGGIGIANTGKIEVGCEKGRRYYNGKWSNIDNSKPLTSEFKTGFDLNGRFEGNLGLYLKIPLKIDKLVGPYLMVGSRIEAEANGQVMLEIPRKEGDPLSKDFHLSVDWWAGAQVGAEIKFMDWKIGTPAVEFQLFKKNLFLWPEED